MCSRVKVEIGEYEVLKRWLLSKGRNSSAKPSPSLFKYLAPRDYLVQGERQSDGRLSTDGLPSRVRVAIKQVIFGVLTAAAVLKLPRVFRELEESGLVPTD